MSAHQKVALKGSAVTVKYVLLAEIAPGERINSVIMYGRSSLAAMTKG